ncbi:MAG: thiamine-phosphate kinase [Dehalobacterium sp.]
MSRESDLIKKISTVMPRSEHQLNKLFESDAEIIEFGGSRMLFSIDEFSREDMMREHDPFTLGWNLAVGGVSDILAAGGRPLFYAHNMTVDKNWTEDYIKSFSQGVAGVLEKSQTSFMGGDFGRSNIWRYTAAVIGILEGKPLLRSGASAGDGIYLSGRIGAGNLEAFLKVYSENKGAEKLARVIRNRFFLRLDEAKLIRKYAKACTDTSDGVFNALNLLAEMSRTGYEVRDLPYIKTGEVLARMFSIPKTLLFLGECGEYELIFTVGTQNEEEFLLEAKNKGMKFFKIGRIREKGRILNEDNREIDLSSLHVRARDFDDMREYIKVLVDFMEES